MGRQAFHLPPIALPVFEDFRAPVDRFGNRHRNRALRPFGYDRLANPVSHPMTR
jgi:hypothetical protein